MNILSVEKEIQSLPGNAPVLDELYKLLESGEALALVGAGASAALWPLWDGLLKGFIELGQKHAKITPAEAEFFAQEAPKTPLETAQLLRRRIGAQLYFEHLEETFSDKISLDTGGAFTPTHRALLQLPIRNYLTLNYDAGLTNARAALYPNATTSYFLWYHEEARRILERQYKRQILHAHGRHDLSDSIILTQDDYQKAYKNPAFVRLLDHVFAYEKLLIIGFGMGDPYIKQLFNNINADYKKSPSRHIAFVGLEEKDLPVAHLLRERVEMVYGARILFYPAKDKHQALSDWLAALADKLAAAGGSHTAENVQPHAVSPKLKQKIADHYIHRPSDDANYEGRAREFVTLNRWANDPATRTVAITGIGGQGKTALVGRWLKQERTSELAKMPVFYWSFYEDLDVGKFLEQMVKFCLPIVRVVGKIEIEAISFILNVVQQARLLLILDGLEVLQEDASSPTHGRINHPLLEQLLQQWLRYRHQGLMLLTSRFRFPQLERFSGVGFHHLNLARLSTEDGCALLKKLGLLGEQKLLENYVEKLYGHPLALRVLASTVKRSSFGDLAQFNGASILAAAGEDDRLSQKLKRLLGFYERQLKNGQKELLGVISLFKRPVEIKSLVKLLDNMKSLENTPLAQANAAEIEKQIDLLRDDFLIEKTREGITTHPVIRDYFRTGNKIAGSRREVADFLKARPGAERPQNIQEVRDLVEAVQLLCDEGEFKTASDLGKSRLAEWGYGFDVFRNLPAVAEGLEFVMAFVGDEVRQQKAEKTLGRAWVAANYAGAGAYNYFLGNSAQALDWWYKALEIYTKLQNKSSQAVVSYEISLIEIAIGNIRHAQEIVSQALSLSDETKVVHELKREFAYKAYYKFLLGNTKQAYQNFEIALSYEQKRMADEQYFSSIEGNYQAEFFIRLQAWKQFEKVNAWNIQNCEKYHWNDILAVCHLLQGWSKICRGQLTDAEKVLTQAERILRPSGMVQAICRLDWVWALLAEAKGEYDKSLQRVNDALFTAADKGFCLWQTDLLVLRGRLRLQQFRSSGPLRAAVNAANLGEAKSPTGAGLQTDLLEQARDDGDAALKIADDTGYVWPKVEALELLASYHQTRAGLANFNSPEEKDKAQSYAKEAESIKKVLFLTEAQMQELKAQARQEFEKQTAGWEK